MYLVERSRTLQYGVEVEKVQRRLQEIVPESHTSEEEDRVTRVEALLTSLRDLLLVLRVLWNEGWSSVGQKISFHKKIISRRRSPHSFAKQNNDRAQIGQVEGVTEHLEKTLQEAGVLVLRVAIDILQTEGDVTAKERGGIRRRIVKSTSPEHFV